MMRTFVSFALWALAAIGMQGTACAETKLRIGWQTTWATQGQLALILRNTDILQHHGLSAEFVGFPYGGPMNEAAVAGEVNVILTADQPGLTLISKNSEWRIAARLMYNSGALIVPPGSQVRSIADLRGRQVAVPYVAAVHRLLVELEKDAKMDPRTDITNVNLGINEIMTLAATGRADDRWGEISAAMVWDPAPILLSTKGLAKIVDRRSILSLILVHDSVAANGEVIEKLQSALADAYQFYRDNRAVANEWFAKEAKLDLAPAILDSAASIEPNLSQVNKVRVRLNSADVATLGRVNSFLSDEKLIKSPVDLTQAVLPDAKEPG